jgi:hypothetical protein
MNLSTISYIKLNEATLCPDLDCSVVSNRKQCPCCNSETIPLHRVVNETLRDVIDLAPAIQ